MLGCYQMGKAKKTPYESVRKPIPKPGGVIKSKKQRARDDADYEEIDEYIDYGNNNEKRGGTMANI